MAEKPSLDAIFQDVGSKDSRPSLESLYTPQEKTGLDLLDVPGQAYANLIPSAKRAGESLIQPFVHPIETAKGLYKLGRGVTEKLSRTSLDPKTGNITFDRGAEGEYEKHANAVGQFLADRYGGWENIKKTIATDPVGFVLDIATVPGGEAMLVRAPGALGRLVGHGISEVGGFMTGQGPATIAGAAKASYKGGREGEAFFENLGASEQAQGELVPKARAALDQILVNRSQAYLKDMKAVGEVRKPIPYTDIDRALEKGHEVETFMGQDIGKTAGLGPFPADEVRNKIRTAVDNWKAKGDLYATPIGMDALKRAIGKLKDSLPFRTPERKVAETAYGAIRNAIAKEAPVYGAAMKDYERASAMIDEIERTLSLRRGATEDTALRKLLSSTRSGVNTNFGRRSKLVEELNRIDPTIVPSLHGQALSQIAPSGLVGKGVAGAGIYELLAHHGVAGLLNPRVLATLAASSPRIWGELVGRSGQVAGKVRRAIPQEIIDAATEDRMRSLLSSIAATRAAGGASALE